MDNREKVKIGIVVGSTDWMPSDLAIERCHKLVSSYKSKFSEENIYECPICLTDNEINIKRVLKDLYKSECNALCIYFANYGPESAGTLLATEFSGPVMLIGAAEEGSKSLGNNRTDALSGFINASYALKLRNKKVYIPKNPVGTFNELSNHIHEFFYVASTLLSLKKLKVISFGPRPSSYLASMVSLNPLYTFGLDISEYSELELYNSYIKHNNDNRIAEIVNDMKSEISYFDTNMLEKFAQYEVTLNDFIRAHKGNRDFVTMTSTCWPAFPINFGFVPCYVNSRFTGKGIPVSCEVDVYGSVSEYIGQVISDDIVTILNINNNVPEEIYNKSINGKLFNNVGFDKTDLFIGYHCGVTNSSKLVKPELKNHFVNENLIGDEKSKGTIHGRIVDGNITLFRIQANCDGELMAYIVTGQILPIDINTYGSYGIIGVKSFDGFLRKIVLDKGFPNHTTVVFGDHFDKLFYTLELLGIKKDNIYIWEA